MGEKQKGRVFVNIVCIIIVLSLFSCTTTQQWTGWQLDKQQRNIVGWTPLPNTNTLVTTRSEEYTIKLPLLSMFEFRVPVIKSILEEQKYIINKPIKYNYKIDSQYKRTLRQDTDASVLREMGLVMWCAGLIGVFLGYELRDSLSTNTETLFYAIGIPTGILGLIFALIQGDTKTISSETEVRVSYEDKIEETIQESPVSKKILADAQPAENVAVEYSEGSLTRSTDENGIAVFPAPDNSTFMPAGLGKLYDSHAFARMIQPTIQSIIKADVMKSAEKKKTKMTLSTSENQNNSTIIKNARSSFTADVYSITDELFFTAVRNFINREINAKILPLNLFVRDDLTRSEVTQVDVTVTTDSPDKDALAGNYFSGKLASYANSCISDYLVGANEGLNSQGGTRYFIYTPSVVKIETIHPEYLFFSGDFTMRNQATKTVFLIEKGRKVMVETTKSGNGRLE